MIVGGNHRDRVREGLRVSRVAETNVIVSVGSDWVWKRANVDIEVGQA